MTPLRSNLADEPTESARPRGAALGVAWMFAVLAFYLFYNHAYFSQKIATFGRFLLAGGA